MLYPKCLTFFIFIFAIFISKPILLSQKGKLSPTDSILNVLRTSDPEQDHKRIEKLFTFHFPRDVKSAEEALNLAEAIILKKKEHDRAFLQIINYRGNILGYHSLYDSMGRLMHYGLRYADSINAPLFRGFFYNNIGIYHERRGTVDSAIYFYKKSLNYSQGVAFRTHNNLARALQRKGDLSEAIDHYTLAMTEAKNRKLTNGQAIIANNIGACYKDSGNDSMAMQYYLKSIELKDSIGDERGKLFALINMIDCTPIDSMKKVYIDQGLHISQEINQKTFISTFTQRLAQYLAERGQNNEALHILKPIYDSLDIENQQEKHDIRNTLSEIYHSLKKHKLSEVIYLENLQSATKVNDIFHIQRTRLNLMSLYQSTQNYEKYAKYADSYIQTNDSLHQLKNLDKFAELEQKLDEEQKKQVQLLNLTIQQEEKSGLRLKIIGLLIGLLLLSILYFRNKKIKIQREVIQRETEAAQRLESLNEELKDLNTFKSQLFTNISHEFRTPLSVILGVTEQLKNTENEDDHLLRKYNLIHRNGSNLLDLVNQLLALNKLETNTLKVNYQQGDLIHEVKYLSESFQSLIESKNMDFSFSSNLDSLMMDYDVEKIRYIIFNLLSNAIKYTPQDGNISIQVSTEDSNENDNPSMVVIRVEDSGIGISEQEINQIFNRFFQGENEINRTGGTGVGLSLTKELIELLQGQITVQSILNEGSTFTVRLPISNKAPLQTQSHDEISRIQSTNKAIDEVHIPSELPKILIIEDNHDVSEYIRSCLINEFEVFQSFNGQEGIDEAMRIIPDLILSDIMMPMKDGYEVCEELKSNEVTSHIPIILLTAKADQSSKLEGLKKRADEYLIKP